MNAESGYGKTEWHTFHPSKKQRRKAVMARKRGQPTAYRPEYVAQAEKLCLLGATDSDLADFFGVASRTIARWSNEHAEFCQSLKDAKDIADKRVERSLYHRANGYSYNAVKIFMPAGAKEPVYAPYVEHVPPDTTACIFWLKNRQSAKWRDVHKHELGGVGDFDNLSDAELAKRAAELLADCGPDGDGTQAPPDQGGLRGEPSKLH